MNLDLAEIAIVITALALSISVHESMHSLVAYFLGDGSSRVNRRVSLNPLHHIDPLTTIALALILNLVGAQPFGAAKPVQVTPWALKGQEYGMALVAVVGPLSNLLLAILAGLILSVVGYQAGYLSIFLAYLTSVNVGLAVFNLIPFPPLDGSRVLYAIAPDSLRSIMDKIESFGFASIIFFMVIIYPNINQILKSINQYILNLF